VRDDGPERVVTHDALEFLDTALGKVFWKVHGVALESWCGV